MRRNNNEEEGPWPSLSFSLVDRRGDLAAAFIARYIRPAISGVLPLPALSAGNYSASWRRARSHVRPNASHPPSSTDSAIVPHGATRACVGGLISGPMLIAMLGNANDYPALYPCPDMFMAPFLARMAGDVDGGVVGGP